MPLEIVRNDITRMKVDAIVNAANSALQMGGGVCGAIFAAAGADALQEECDRIEHCDVGRAVITKGYALPAKFVIHTVGPVWRGGSHNEEKLLTSCYASSLSLAMEHGCKSIAFPLISSGIFGYPKDQALQVAIAAIGAFLLEHEMQVYLVVYDKTTYHLSDRLFNSIEAYIDDHYVDEEAVRFSSRRSRQELDWIEQSLHDKSDVYMEETVLPRVPMAPRSLEDVMAQMEEPFSRMLLRLIDEKGRNDVEVYKSANIDRRHGKCQLRVQL